jgi:hypothetical protein
LLLDTADGDGPWYSTNARALATCSAGAFPSMVSVEWADAPSQSIPVVFYNPIHGRATAPVPNYLWRIWHRLDFTTVLASAPPLGNRIEPLKYFDWTVDYDVDFRPRVPVEDGPWPMTVRAIGINVGPVRDGMPADARIADAITEARGLPLVRRFVSDRADPRVTTFPDWNVRMPPRIRYYFRIN